MQCASGAWHQLDHLDQATVTAPVSMRVAEQPAAAFVLRAIIADTVMPAIRHAIFGIGITKESAWGILYLVCLAGFDV